MMIYILQVRLRGSLAWTQEKSLKLKSSKHTEYDKYHGKMPLYSNVFREKNNNKLRVFKTTTVRIEIENLRASACKICEATLKCLHTVLERETV